MADAVGQPRKDRLPAGSRAGVERAVACDCGAGVRGSIHENACAHDPDDAAASGATERSKAPTIAANGGADGGTSGADSGGGGDWPEERHGVGGGEHMYPCLPPE